MAKLIATFTQPQAFGPDRKIVVGVEVNYGYLKRNYSQKKHADRMKAFKQDLIKAYGFQNCTNISSFKYTLIKSDGIKKYERFVVDQTPTEKEKDTTWTKIIKAKLQ